MCLPFWKIFVHGQTICSDLNDRQVRLSPTRAGPAGRPGRAGVWDRVQRRYLEPKILDAISRAAAVEGVEGTMRTRSRWFAFLLIRRCMLLGTRGSR